MEHAINALPNYHNRSAWDKGAASLLTRILCKRETVDQATLPLLRHQCDVALRSGVVSPALCSIGTAQVLAYSVMLPETMVMI